MTFNPKYTITARMLSDLMRTKARKPENINWQSVLKS